ncbi:hypothetical protein D3C80_941200 [compost metagenome]
MHGELVVTVVVRNAKLVRELTAVGLNHISDTSTESAFNTGQFLEHFITCSVTRIAQPLLVHFIRVLSQHCTWRTTGINQLIGYGIATVWIRSHLTHNHCIDTQRRPGGWLNFLSRTRLLWQTRTIQWIEFAAVAKVSGNNTTNVFRRSARARPLERNNTNRTCRVHPLGDLNTYFCVQHSCPQHKETHSYT